MKNNVKFENAKAKNNVRMAESKARFEEVKVKNTLVNKLAIDSVKTMRKYGFDSNEFANCVTRLAVVLVCGKLKRLYRDESTSREVQRDMRNSIIGYFGFDDNTIDNIERKGKELSALYSLEISEDGEYISKCKDKGNANDIVKDMQSVVDFGQKGFDLVGDTRLFLLEKVKAFEGKKRVKNTALIDIYKKPIDSKNYYKKSGEAKPKELWQFDYTNAVKEASIFVGDIIRSNCHIADTTTAWNIHEIDYGEYKYKAYMKADNIEIDDDGKANEEVRVRIQEVESLITGKINKTQRIVFIEGIKKGKSNSQISDEFDIAIRTIEDAKKSLLKVIIDTGFLQEKTGLKPIENKAKPEVKIYAYKLSNGMEYEFKSLGEASRVLMVDKGNISRVLKGERDNTKGYVFTYCKK